MQQPSPAIVPQSAVRRLPRLPLLLLCLAYVLPGFVGRDPWRSEDIAGFGLMWELAQGHAAWSLPQWPAALLPGAPAADGLLPYWLGAAAIRACAGWLAPDLAVRLPFMLLLGLTLTACWQAVYGLARSPRAQPVMFAFGGEAHPADYARAIADGGLLALMASLGLALLAHETTVAAVQLCAVSLSFFGATHLIRGKPLATLVMGSGLAGLCLSGAPSIAVILGAGCGLILPLQVARERRLRVLLQVAACTLLAAALAQGLDLWRWRLQAPPSALRDLKGMGRLLLWFGWPASLLAVWTLWRWRRLWRSPHLALPLWFLGVAVVATLLTASAERSLLLGLPALAALAAFALPTLSRTVSALIDWFTLLFFSGWALVVWVVWLAMQTGVPAQPAANVARLLPGFVPVFSPLALAVAALASLAWVALVRWRIGRHPAAIWKSLVLPAGGATLGWVLVMTLLLAPLDYGLSSRPLVQQIQRVTQTEPGCLAVHGLSPGLITALRYHGQAELAAADADCPWLLFVEDIDRMRPGVNTLRWQDVDLNTLGPRGGERVQIYRRLPATGR